MDALEAALAELRATIESDSNGGDPSDAAFRQIVQAKLDELARAMAAERAAVDALAKQPAPTAPVVNATIVVPADPKTPLVRTVERNADGLITKITDAPAEAQ
jgi:hypothetical protein